MFFKRQQLNKGFTLVELLTCLGIFVVLFGIIIIFVIWTYRSNVMLQALNEVSTNTQRALEVIMSEVRAADSIYTPTTNSEQLSLETFRYTAQGEKTSFVDFFVCQSQICMKKDSETMPIAITSDKVKVEKLNFIVISGIDSPDVVQVVLEFSYKQNSGALEEQPWASATSTAVLRNY